MMKEKGGQTRFRGIAVLQTLNHTTKYGQAKDRTCARVHLFTASS